MKLDGEPIPADSLDIEPDRLDGRVLQVGKRLAFLAVARGKLPAFYVKIFPPDGLRPLQGVALLAR